MSECVAAWTKPEGSYPEYFNVTRDGNEVVITVRSAPTVRDGAYVCGFTRDRGQPGRCTPGDERCNNYCSLAPQKGPMQDHPLPCQQIFEGTTASMRMPLLVFQQLFGGR